MNDNFLPLEAAAPKIIKRKNQNVFAASVANFRGLVKHQILDAEADARSIVGAARRKADDFVAAAEREAEEIRGAAYRAGREEAESELLENLLMIKEERARVFKTVEEDILKLAVKLAEKVIGREIADDAGARAEIVLNALRAARQQEMLTVRVNAGDLPLLEQMRERISAFGRAQYIDFIADQTVRGSGGCIIESQSGTIDARVETQLRLLESALLARVSSET